MSKKKAKKVLSIYEFIGELPFFELVNLVHKYGYEMKVVPIEKGGEDEH